MPHNKDPLSRTVIDPMVVFLDSHPLVWAPASGAYHLKLQAHSQVVRESSKRSTECHLLRLLPGRCQIESCFQLEQAQQPRGEALTGLRRLPGTPR